MIIKLLEINFKKFKLSISDDYSIEQGFGLVEFGSIARGTFLGAAQLIAGRVVHRLLFG